MLTILATGVHNHIKGTDLDTKSHVPLTRTFADHIRDLDTQNKHTDGLAFIMSMESQNQAIPMTRRRTESRIRNESATPTDPEQEQGSRSTRKWYLLIGRGMYRDVRNRLPYYKSDWTDAWNYRVVPATLVSFLAGNRDASVVLTCRSLSFR